MRDSGGTDIALVNYKTQAHATFGGAAGGTSAHTYTYDFANHELDADYTVIAALTKVTVIMPDPYIATWDNSTQLVFGAAFRREADQVTVTARIRRSGSVASDAYTGVRIVISDQDGSNSTSVEAVANAVGTSWEDLTTGAIDVSGYGTEMEWALEVYTRAAPAASTNATTTIHVHDVTVEQL
jgi:hypothetical protein